MPLATVSLVKPCTTSVKPKNTGIECNTSMGPTSMIMLMPMTESWTAANEADFLNYATARMQAAVGNRWYPLFGQAAPIRTITNGKESDVIETLDDGSMAFIRYGMYSRTFLTNDGGDCLAKALASFLNLGYGFIELDNALHIRRRVNSDGTFGPFALNLGYAPAPDLADLKTTYKNAYFLNFSPTEYITNGQTMTTTGDLTGMKGLIDVDVTDATGSSATKLKVNILTECAGTNLASIGSGALGTALAVIGNFVVTKTSDGTAVTITAAAVVGTHFELTGTFTSATSYTIALADSVTLYGAGVIGYEGQKSVAITIP